MHLSEKGWEGVCWQGPGLGWAGVLSKESGILYWK